MIRIMNPAHNITQKMEGITIQPKATALTPYNATMESTHEITQEMEDMTLDPKAQADTPFTATTPSHAQRGSSQQQHQSSPPAPFISAGNPTGGYVYATTFAGLNFSNPNASSSSSTTTTDTSNITTTTAPNQFQDQDLCDHLLNCDDPVGFLKYSLYHSHLPSKSLSHKVHKHTSSSASNRITKSRSTSCPRERYHHAHHARHVQPGSMTPTMGTTVYKAAIKKVPGTKTIYTTTAEEEAAKEKEMEKERMTMAFVEDCLKRTTKARVTAEKDAAEAAARERQMKMRSEGSGMGGACGEASGWFLRVQERAKRTWVNEEGDFVEESRSMPWGEVSEGFDGMDDVEDASVLEEKREDDDEMME